MSYLSIVVRKDTAFAERILSRWQLRFYLAKLNIIYSLTKNRLGKYIVEEGKDYFVTREENTPEVIERELHKLQRFLFADENTLAKEEKWNETNDRILRKVYQRTKMFKVRTESKAVKAALQGNSVLSFLNSIGIIIEYESDVENVVNNEKISL